MIAVVYESFNNEIDTLKVDAQRGMAIATKTASKDWSDTKDSKNTSSRDIDTLSEKFARQDCQDAYTDFLKGKKGSTPIDATIIKFQNGVIAAHELAYRVQHATTPRSLAAGLCDISRWSNAGVPVVLNRRLECIMGTYKEDAKKED